MHSSNECEQLIKYINMVPVLVIICNVCYTQFALYLVQYGT